jgi:hypothetical protein
MEVAGPMIPGGAMRVDGGYVADRLSDSEKAGGI